MCTTPIAFKVETKLNNEEKCCSRRLWFRGAKSYKVGHYWWVLEHHIRNRVRVPIACHCCEGM